MVYFQKGETEMNKSGIFNPFCYHDIDFRKLIEYAYRDNIKNVYVRKWGKYGDPCEYGYTTRYVLWVSWSHNTWSIDIDYSELCYFLTSGLNIIFDGRWLKQIND